MAEEFEGTETSADVDTSSDYDSSQDTQETPDTQDTPVEEQKPQEFKEILKGEMDQKAGRAGPGIRQPLDGLDGFFAKSELAAIKALPLETQQAVDAMVNRVADTASKRIEAYENAVQEYVPAFKALEGAAQSIYDNNYKSAGDYLEHLISFDKEMTTHPEESIATLIFNHAGGSAESLEAFVGRLEDAIYDIRDKYHYSLSDRGTQMSIQQAKAARDYKAKYEAYENERVQQINELAAEASQNAIKLFEKARDGAGNLMYPHFRKVVGIMSDISKRTGEEDLEELYYMACAKDPKIRTLLTKQAQAPQPNFAMTNSPASTKTSKGGLPSLRECFEQAKNEKAMMAY
jgi:hypothetical protein